MIEILSFLVLSLCCYLIGSISFGRILSKYTSGIDLTKVGSGNTGATNVLRNSGPLLGFTVLFLDMFKSILPVLILSQFNFINYEWSLQFFALLFVIGHCYPIYSKFKGGKGVATGIGPLAIIFFPSSLVALIVFLTLIVMTRYVSAGSIIGCLSALISMLIFNMMDLYNSTYYDLIYLVPAISIIIFKHSENISRLINNNENKLSFSKK